MKASRRRWLQVLGLTVFVVVLFLSLRNSPPDLTRLEAGWLALAVGMASLTITMQVVQTEVFLSRESLRSDWRWSAWFTAEKAWMNTVFPAKVGTAGAMVYLVKAHDLAWHQYLRFMLLCGGITATASLATALMLVLRDGVGVLCAIILLLTSLPFLNVIYRVKAGHLLVLAGSSIVSLVALTVGVGACILGLGHHGEWSSVVPVGALLNLLSVVAVTPGNFGFRELVLATAAPLLKLDFGVVVQASTCYVFLRLLVGLGLATYLRSSSLSAFE